MILLATSVVLAWLSQSDLSNKDQRTVIPIRHEQQGPTDGHSASMDDHLPKSLYVLVYRIHCCLERLYIAIDHLASVFYLNMVATEHCTFFREYIVHFKHPTITDDM
jgi:hypothetical protein